MENRRKYTIKELAAEIGYGPDTVYEWAATRGLPTHRACPRGRITIYWDEFDTWWERTKAE